MVAEYSLELESYREIRSQIFLLNVNNQVAIGKPNSHNSKNTFVHLNENIRWKWLKKYDYL